MPSPTRSHAALGPIRGGERVPEPVARAASRGSRPWRAPAGSKPERAGQVVGERRLVALAQPVLDEDPRDDVAGEADDQGGHRPPPDGADREREAEREEHVADADGALEVEDVLQAAVEVVERRRATTSRAAIIASAASTAASDRGSRA